MDSPISWMGGKSLSAQKIVDLLPKHTCYCEIFAGGLWVFFRKQPSEIEVINDVNSELINLYRILQQNYDEFMKRETYQLYSSELYYEYLNDFKSGKHEALLPVERAFRFFVLIKQSFGAKFGAGFAFSSTRTQTKSFFNQFKDLDKITERLKNCIIDNRDFQKIIESYDNKETVLFCDPPYIDSNNADYYFKSSKNTFTIHDHQRLFLALKDIKGKCIVTIDDTVWVRERYTTQNGFYTIENKVNYSSGGGDNSRQVTELIITNYNPNEQKKHVDTKQETLSF